MTKYLTMKKLTFLFFLTFGVVLYAQNDKAYVDSLTQEFTQKLSQRGISTYFLNEHYCSGKIEMFQIDGKMCTSKGTYYEVYIVWKEDEKDHIKKIDNCGLHHTSTLSDTSLTNFYESEYPALINDEVKPYRSETYTGEPELRKEVEPCFREFKFVKGSREDHKKFNLFALTNDSDGKNINYTFNQTLKLVSLHNQMEDALASLMFKRQK